MIQFEHTIFAWAFLLLPLLTGLFLWMRSWQKKALARFGDSAIIHRLFPDASPTKPWVKFLLLLTAVSFMVVALINPQIGSKLTSVKREGVELVLALDISNSMRAQDLTPDRLERSKKAVEKLIDNLDSDKIGLVVFAGEAFVQLPMTTDYASAKLFLSSVDPSLIDKQGTEIEKAIRTSIDQFSKQASKNKAIVIISDGESTLGDPLKAAQEAKEQGIKVFTIGIGSEEGVPIPMYENQQIIGYKKDKSGNTVISKLNEPMLKEIAQLGGGSYVRASNANFGLDQLMNDIQKLEKTQFESKMYTDHEDRFQIFVAIALLLLLLELFVGDKKGKLLRKLNLFKEHNT